MPKEYYIDLLRMVDITMIFLMIILFFKNYRRDQNVKVGIVYLFSLIFLLLLSWDIVKESNLYYVFLLGDFSVTILFWYLCKSIFDDNFKLGRNYILLYLVIIAVYYLLYYFEHFSGINFKGTSNSISLIFVVLGILEALRNRSIDLLESRIRLRSIFIFVAGILNILILVISISESSEVNSDNFNLFQIIAIGIILISFYYYLVEFQSGFFFEKPKIKQEEIKIDPKISEEFNRTIKNEKIYLQEGLTIRKLAIQMNEQEYKVRRYINQHLGFRNFNDFLNSYRIQDACELLLDENKSDLTVLEIAYSLGYNSLGPFNKAFKKDTGMTPTTYRKQG
jgi:AraC-like DNA-binding protein